MKAVLAQVVICYVYDKSKQNKQHKHGIITTMLTVGPIKFFISFYPRAPCVSKWGTIQCDLIRIIDTLLITLRRTTWIIYLESLLKQIH